jgi:hypothetical protein
MQNLGRPIVEGDRLEWTGPNREGIEYWPRTGERGWAISIDGRDDVVTWDEAGTSSGWDVQNSPDIIAIEGESRPAWLGRRHPNGGWRLTSS